MRKSTFVRKDSDFGQQGALSAYPYPVNEESVVLAQNPRGRKAGRERDHNRDDNPKPMDLSGELVKDITGKRYWSRAYVNLMHSTWLGKKRNYWADRIWIGNPDHPVLNWVASSSTPKLIPPCSRGSRTSKLFLEMLDKGHAAGLTDAECRTLALWVDLGVPFCGAYDELVDWDANDRARWNRAILRRERFRTSYEP